jgi:hypothetical protein
MTELKLHPSPLRVFEDVDGETREIKVSTPLSSFFASDRIRLHFTGTLPPIPDLHLSNFIESVLDHFQAEDIDFSLCDFKDCAIRSSVFRRCKFNNNSFLMNIVIQSEFVECSFYNFSSQGSEFRNTRFVSCDLTNMLVKSARFVGCEFVDCRTSNKIMEMSMVIDTKFVRTDIQVDTITSNFGITVGDLDESKIRNGRVRDPHDLLLPEELSSITTSALSSLERLRLEYFTDPNLTEGSDALDESVAIGQWARIYKSPTSVSDLFELFAEFLMLAYERERITLQPLLLLHAATAELTAAASPTRNYQRVAISVGGVHLMISRVVEEFLHTLDAASAICGTRVKMLVEGPLDKSYYSQRLAPWLKRDRVAITSIVPHNSPAEITFEAANAAWLIPLLAVFLATRTSLQISRLEADLHVRPRVALPAAAKPAAVDTTTARQPKTELVTFSSGRSSKSKDYQIHVRAVISKSLLIDLKLQIGTKIAGKLRKILRILFFD